MLKVEASLKKGDFCFVIFVLTLFLGCSNLEKEGGFMIKVELESGSSISNKPAKVLVFENGKLVAFVTATIELAPCASNELNEYIKLVQDVFDPIVVKPSDGNAWEKMLKSVEG